MHLLLTLILLGVIVFGAALGPLCLAEVNPPAVPPESGAVTALGWPP